MTVLWSIKLNGCYFLLLNSLAYHITIFRKDCKNIKVCTSGWKCLGSSVYTNSFFFYALPVKRHFIQRYTNSQIQIVVLLYISGAINKENGVCYLNGGYRVTKSSVLVMAWTASAINYEYYYKLREISRDTSPHFVYFGGNHNTVKFIFGNLLKLTFVQKLLLLSSHSPKNHD